MFSNRYGLGYVLKDGSRSFGASDEAILRSIEACRALTQITQTSLGPNSMNKLLINHMEKHFVTSDASTILDVMDVQHPAAKVLVMACQMQQHEFGDFTNYTLVFAGELLNQAECLLKQGLHPADIVQGYELALSKCLSILQDNICWKLVDVRSVEELTAGISTCLSSKQFSLQANLAKLVAEAAIQAMPPNVKDFDTDNIRVAKIAGGCMGDSRVAQGMLIPRDTSGICKHKSNAKVMVLGCGLEMTGTEAKGTVLLHNAEELLNFTKGEENRMEQMIKEMKAAGVEAIIINGAIADTAQHYCDKYSILTLKIMSKFDIRRICKTLRATALVRLGVPLPDELGFAESISVQEIASHKVTVINSGNSKVATIVLRGSTMGVLEELERGVDDAINCVKAITTNPAFVAGGGASDIQIATRLQEFGATVEGLDQYAALKFGEAFEAIPSILGENAGHNSTEVITALYAAHHHGNSFTGVDVSGGSLVKDMKTAGIFDHYETKKWAIQLATEAALTVLKVDQIIMARPAGGPKPRERGAMDDD